MADIKEIIVAQGGGKPALKVNLIPPTATDVQSGTVVLSDELEGTATAATGKTAATPFAVAEVNRKIGRLSDLDTDDQSNIVNALNEVKKTSGGEFVYVVRPKILEPTDGSTDLLPLLTVRGNQYLNVFASDSRAYREFQIALDEKFISIAQQGKVNADEWQTPVPLATQTKHYIRVRDFSTEGFYSTWSKVTTITTRATPIHVETPVITLKGYAGSPTDIGSGVDIQGSAFAVSDMQEDEHVSTSWSISQQGQEEPIWQSLDDATHKESITVPNKTFIESTDYVLKVTYKGAKFGESAPAVVEFRTSTDFGVVNAPTLEVKGAPSSVYESPLLTGGSFSNTREPDTHGATDWEIISQSTQQPVWQSLNNTSDLKSIEVPSGILQVSSAYIARVRYKGNIFGWSDWTEVKFSTVDIFAVVETPTVSTEDALDYDPRMEFTGSPFAMQVGPQGVHDMTDWVFYSTEEPVQEVFASRNDKENLTSTPPRTLNGHITQGKTYLLKVRYHDGNTGTWSKYGEFRFTATAREFSDPIVGPFVGTKGIHFIGVISDPNENFFDKATIYKPDASLFRVYINGELDPQQNIYSLTYPNDAEVLIESIDKKTKFPWFNAKNKNFIKRFLEPLPALYRTEDELVLDYSYTFFDAYALEEIPEYFLGNIWQQNGKAVDFRATFQDCTALKKIPENLFNKRGFVGEGGEVKFVSTFRGCSTITTIPAGLFRYIRNASTFGGPYGYCFEGCDNGCFQYCSSLTTIPENLFANNKAVTDFQFCFQGCASLTTIPENLFANNTAVTNFNNCFQGCASLTTIPENLFANNKAVTDFNNCFRECVSLTTIPLNLFANNTAVIIFRDCFRECSNLIVKVRIGSKVVGTVYAFAKNTKSRGTVYVPRGSKTAITFKNATHPDPDPDPEPMPDPDNPSPDPEGPDPMPDPDNPDLPEDPGDAYVNVIEE